MATKSEPNPQDQLRELAKLALARKDSVLIRRAAEKLAAGQPITQREEAALTLAAAGDPSPSSPQSYVGTWDELATALSIEERTLYDFRQRHAPRIKALGRTLTRADGRHVIASWRKLADELGELQGRGLNNPNADHIDERALRLRERQLAVERETHKLAVQRGEVLPLTEYQSALRLTVVAFDAALQQIPGRAAEALGTAARTACLALLRAELTPKQFERIEKVLEKAPLDHAEITRILTDEIEACRRALAEADFMTAEETGNAGDTAPAE